MCQKLKSLIDYGADIEFTLNGKQYVILPWLDDGIVIGLKNSEYDDFYPDFEELMLNHVIDGKKFAHQIENITIDFTSGQVKSLLQAFGKYEY